MVSLVHLTIIVGCLGLGVKSQDLQCAANCAESTWSGHAGPGGRTWNTGPGAFCTNDTLITSVSTCIRSSSCNDADQSALLKSIAQVCANLGHTLSQSEFATYSVTGGGSAWPTSWTSAGPWGPWGSPGWGNSITWPATWSIPTGFPSSGPGPWQGGGPFGGRGHPWSSGPWLSGPWTSWWGRTGCPPTDWPGWTTGPWSTNAPWTTWTGCTAQTTSTAVITSTVDGSPVLSTTYGYQVAQATAASETQTGEAAVESIRTSAVLLYAFLAMILIL